MPGEGFVIEAMAAVDYREVLSLWRDTEGIGLHDDTDSRQGVASYLARNPGLSFVARRDGRIVGAVLCGHDGRRGYLHHLAVAKDHRRAGLGRALVDACLAKLGKIGIAGCNLFLFCDNQSGENFWTHLGWNQRPELKVFQTPTRNG